MKYRYESHPHPHIFIEELVLPNDYARMRFPDELIEPTESWGITSGDEQYGEVMQDPLWRNLRDEMTSEAFVRAVLGEFSSEMRAAECLVDPEHFRLVDFVESREEKEAPQLDLQADPNEVFTRLDFQSKGAGQYREFVHLDWSRRIIGGILFFSDQQEEGLEGGELALFRDKAFRNDRWCHEPELLVQFPARHNTGVIFLNSNSGFHGPREIRKLEGRRRWLYFTISSKADVWPAIPRPK
jgi:hypothetical protein